MAYATFSPYFLQALGSIPFGTPILIATDYTRASQEASAAVSACGIADAELARLCEIIEGEEDPAERLEMTRQARAIMGRIKRFAVQACDAKERALEHLEKARALAVEVPR